MRVLYSVCLDRKLTNIVRAKCAFIGFFTICPTLPPNDSSSSEMIDGIARNPSSSSVVSLSSPVPTLWPTQPKTLHSCLRAVLTTVVGYGIYPRTLHRFSWILHYYRRNHRSHDGWRQRWSLLGPSAALLFIRNALFAITFVEAMTAVAVSKDSVLDAADQSSMLEQTGQSALQAGMVRKQREVYSTNESQMPWIAKQAPHASCSRQLFSN